MAYRAAQNLEDHVLLHGLPLISCGWLGYSNIITYSKITQQHKKVSSSNTLIKAKQLF